MAYEVPVLNLTFQAGANLSTAQWTVVKLTTSDTVTIASSASVPPIGVLQNNPTSGLEANVMVLGVSKVRSGAAVSRAGVITVQLASTTRPGHVVALATGGNLRSGGTVYAVGRALEGSTQANDIVPAVINFIPYGNKSS
jgi:hypothetical protein